MSCSFLSFIRNRIVCRNDPRPPRPLDGVQPNRQHPSHSHTSTPDWTMRGVIQEAASMRRHYSWMPAATATAGPGDSLPFVPSRGERRRVARERRTAAPQLYNAQGPGGGEEGEGGLQG